MSCVLIKPAASTTPLGRSRRVGIRAFSFLEMLLAVAVASIFMAGAYGSFIQISRAQENAEARLEAMRNGRSALTTIGTDLSGNDVERVIILPGNPNLLFQGVNQAHPQNPGDGRDDDDDGTADEEIFDGLDNDGDSPGATNRNWHAQLGDTIYERRDHLNHIDLGDRNVDEDLRFGNDSLTFNILSEGRPQQIRYFIGTIDGETHVLLRETTDLDADGNAIGEAVLSPLAFGALGLDLLYWDSNQPAADQNWLVNWDSNTVSGLPLPASVRLRLTLYADRRPLNTYRAPEPVDTLALETQVNIEGIISHPDFKD